jgi:hemerythrin
MPKFEWIGQQHAVHVLQVDDEHRALFGLCGDLECAVAADAPIAQIESILDELIAHAAEHFSHEERQMRTAGYSHYAWHQRQHHAARARVTRLERRIRRGDREAAIELLQYMQGWLNDHIAIADRMLGAFLRNHQRQIEARAS